MKKLYMILPLTLILCFMVGCQDKEAMAELEAMKAQAEIEEQNKEFVKGLLEELNKGNAEIWKECFQMAFKGFPDINWKIQDLIAKGDKVIARITQTGTHEGEYHGIPATGNKTEFGVIPIFQFKDGKCIETREELDALGFMQQLGMELKPKEGEK